MYQGEIVRSRWYKNLKPTLQLLVLLGFLLIVLAFYIPLFSKLIKPAVTSLLSLPLKFCQDLSYNAKQFFSFQDLIQENKRLRKKIDLLACRLVQLEEASLENQRLRNLLSLPQKEPLRTQAALLISKDSSNWSDIIIINKGRTNGIKNDMPVTIGANLAGKVIEAAVNTSKIRLITDFNSKVPAKILRTREDGIVFGTFEKKKNICKMKYLQEVEIGDKIISSGLAEVYPKGLLLGEVIAVTEQESRLYKVAEIKPAVDFSALEEVMVITGQ